MEPLDVVRCVTSSSAKDWETIAPTHQREVLLLSQSLHIRNVWGPVRVTLLGRGCSTSSLLTGKQRPGETDGSIF